MAQSLAGPGTRCRRAQPPAISVRRPPPVQHASIIRGRQRLDNFLLRCLKAPKYVPRHPLGEVRVNRAVLLPHARAGRRRRARAAGAPARPAGTPRCRRATSTSRSRTVLLAIDKPAGVAVHGGSGLSFGVIEQLRRARPGAKFLELVHRLDRDTSGVLLLAKKRSALTALQDQFRARDTGKSYTALVRGDWPERLKVIDVPLHKFLLPDGERRVRTSSADDVQAKRSITLVRVLRRYGGFTLLDVGIKTGRTHQIRVHLAHAGHPIVGDAKYGDFEFNKSLARGEVLPGLRYGGMFLHARRLAFDHPASGERIELEAPLPPECQALLRQLEGSSAA